MNRVPLSIPELAIISGTRAVLGVGLGLLASRAISDERRKGLGWALVGVGAVSTIPIIAEIMRWESTGAPESRNDKSSPSLPAGNGAKPRPPAARGARKKSRKRS